MLFEKKKKIGRKTQKNFFKQEVELTPPPAMI